MKATIDVPDDLYRRIKAKAAMRGMTVRDVTTALYQGWLREKDDASGQQTPSEWLRAWFAAADEAMERAPDGGTAREELAADRRRLDSK
jgi:hypothetical protein